jgi:hypothetical protein
MIVWQLTLKKKEDATSQKNWEEDNRVWARMKGGREGSWRRGGSQEGGIWTLAYTWNSSLLRKTMSKNLMTLFL